MKCVNQSKPEDKRVQEIIEDDDIKNHLISAFISDDCKSVKLPENIVVKASLHNVLQVAEPFGRNSCCRF